MKTLLINIQNQLSSITEFKYIDEDWGQLDYYSNHPPTKYPLILLDIADVRYKNNGVQRNQPNYNRQHAQGVLVITVANIKLTNTSMNAPTTQKNNAWHIQELIDKVNQKLHGFSPLEICSKLIRLSYKRIKRDDGVQEYELTYGFELSNV